MPGWDVLAEIDVPALKEDWSFEREVALLVTFAKGAMVELKGIKKGRLASETRPKAKNSKGVRLTSSCVPPPVFRSYTYEMRRWSLGTKQNGSVGR